MADSYAALRRYNRGQSLNRTGNILLIGGLCIAVGGGVIALTTPFDMQYEYADLRYEYTEWNSNTYKIHYSNKRETELGYWIIGAGAVMSITGITLKMTGSIPVKKSVRFYNGSLNSISRAEFKFDFTGNGVRLALTF
jgi:hypothetical protein